MDKEIKERIAAINSGIIPEGYKKTKVGIVPVEWELSKMKKICEINRGGSPRPIEDYITDDNNGINWIKIGDTSVGGKYISSTKEKIKPEGVRKSRQVFEGDFLLSNSMSYGRPYILKTSGCIHDGWLVISNYSDYFDLEFFYYLLCHHNIQRQYDMLSAGSGVQNLNKDLVAQVDVIIPPLPEQQKIAEILSTQDKLIELQEKKIEQLKELKKAYLQKMFPQKGSKYPKLRFKGFTDPWEQRKVGDVLSESRDAGHSGDIAKKLTVKLWGKGVYAKNDKGSAATQYFTRHAGQFIYSKLDFLNSAFGVVPQELESYESTADLPAFDCIAVDPYFMFYRAIQPSFYLTNGMIADGSRKAKRIHVETFLDMPLDLPSIEEQKKVASYFTQLDSLITLHQHKSEQEKQKKKALMQLLLTGIVRTK